MKTASLYKDLTYQDDKPLVQPLLETDFTREIRIVFKGGQVMKKHFTPFPIVIEIVEGEIDFGTGGTIHRAAEGDLISLEGGIPHDLTALTDSIVRLTLSKPDRSERVKEVANQ
ncbi:cupin domain-containing protein [Persicitalea jodogahamensis]|uniref:Cupin n=1 Tax=Persicitalea jodogahamensis TaxID=402147 RepID=A0A8J3D8A1_9BACT|nr:cupin domain-containing protein [Persicitalea jodogahamensis]GHB86906.1 hypothetical protein GCM10007390_48360 [Persicitalea jodogahamensis]